MSKVQCQKCFLIFESSDAGGFVEHRCASDWQQAKEHPGLTEQRVREIVREEIANARELGGALYQPQP